MSTENRYMLSQQTEDAAKREHSTFVTRAKIKLLFGMKAQIQFIENLMQVLRGAGNEGMTDAAALKIMREIYLHEKDLLSANLEVCDILMERLVEQSMSSAMEGLFNSNFVMLFRSAEESSNIVESINAASITVATVKKEQRMVVFKLVGGTFALLAALVCANYANIAYEMALTEEPQKMMFFDAPLFILNSGTLLVKAWPFLVPLCIGLIAMHIYWLPTWTSELRRSADRYWPPCILYRRLTAIRFFSTLHLMTGEAGLSIKIALQQMKAAATPYDCMHIDQMLDNVEAGVGGASQFDTGLLTARLNIYLKMAAESGKGSIEDALKVISKLGPEETIKALKYASTFIMFIMILMALYVGVQSGFTAINAARALI
ncbi:hypothetical protein [Aliagarivorans taiwanensis]|uniref:hypothetical protein n=1 Tax=Aliagarivorans taiwanensis TaxID=561966 RepID=UPI0003F6D619|nr:hypothetical protein [Aliagarivorans taiwanensis]